MTDTLALHFGVYPRDPQGFDDVLVDGHGDASTEHPFLLNAYRYGNRSAFVSGSWGCWGPADQGTDGDNSLHVLVVLGSVEKVTTELVDALLLALSEVTEARILDYAWVTSAEDWADTRAIATFAGGVYVNTVGSVS